MSYVHFERQILLIRFRFPKIITATLNQNADKDNPDPPPDGPGIQIAPDVFIRPLVIQAPANCPECVSVVFESEALWPTVLSHDNVVVETDEVVETTIEWIPGSDVDCEITNFNNCFQRWLLYVDPLTCEMDGLYSLTWNLLCRENADDTCIIEDRLKFPVYEINLETNENCIGSEEQTAAETELYRNNVRSIDIWRYYNLDDILYGRLTITPDSSLNVLEAPVVTDIWLFEGRLNFFGSSGIHEVITDKVSLSEDGVDMLFSFPVDTEIRKFETIQTDGIPQLFTLKLSGTVLQGDTPIRRGL
eukprot:UN05016